MRLHLIRHPPPAAAAGLCYGRSDLALAQDPAECAATLRARLPVGLPLFTSPLRRCLALAQALHARPVVDERLIEMHFGRWEMQPWTELPRQEIDAWSAAPLTYAPPGGEPVAAVLTRVRAFVAERRAEGCRELAVVTHAGVMKLFAAEALDLPAEAWLSMTFAYCDIFAVDTHD